MNIYDDEYNQGQTGELEFKASLLVTELAELYGRFATCFCMSLSLQAASDVDDIRGRADELEIGMRLVRGRLGTLTGHVALFNLILSEWQRKQRLLKELRREARLGNYGPTSGKQRLIGELAMEVNHLAVLGNEKANLAFECYQNGIKCGMQSVLSKCRQLLERLDNVIQSLQAATAYAVQTQDDSRYQQYTAVLAVLNAAKEALAYVEGKLEELSCCIEADYDRQVGNMISRAELMVPQAIE